MSKRNFVVTGRKFTRYFLFNAEEIVVDKAFYRLSISFLVLEIFPLKLESCPKQQPILDVFAFPNLNRSCKRRFSFIGIFIRSRDIRDQILKLFEKARQINVGQVEMSKHNFVVSKPKSSNFLRLRWNGFSLKTPLTACRCLYSFQRYSRSKSKVVALTVDFGQVEMSKQNFVVSGPKFIKFSLFNAEGTVVDNAVYRLSIS